MIILETVNEPMSKKNVDIHKSILNSHPSYNLVVVGKELLSDEEIFEETNKNYLYGEKTLHIKKNEECVGLITYLPNNTHDNLTWIGLLAIHKKYEREGIGTIALGLLENILREQKIDKVRLCVQHGNDNGASFWNKNGFVKINSTVDQHTNQIDIYEKQL